MGGTINPYCLLVLCSCFIVVIIELVSPSCSTTDHHRQETRNLIQQTKCPIDFEEKNLTIITSACKGPDFPVNVCCTAFKTFACPFVDEINNHTYDCATAMFSYINLYGRYPPGLFANLCPEGKDGLDCEEIVTNAAPRPLVVTPMILSSIFLLLILVI